jgi:hypothetical protein
MRPTGYLDECVDVGLVQTLLQRGHIVLAARDAGPTGVDDDEQIEYAAARGWVIVTHNARHFVRWNHRFRQQGRLHGGIVVIPETGPLDRLTIRAAMMLDWIAQQEYRSCLFRWGDLQKLLVQGFRVPGYTEDEVRRAIGRA